MQPSIPSVLQQCIYIDMAPGYKPKPPYSRVNKICPLATRPYGWQLHCLRSLRLGCLSLTSGLKRLEDVAIDQRRSIKNIGGLWLYTGNSSGWMDFGTFKITQACGDGFPPDIRSFLCFKGEGQHPSQHGIWLGCSKSFAKMSMKQALNC